MRRKKMNWDAVGAIGEIIGAIAVVISVVYLAVQIRSGSEALSTNIRDSVFTSLSQWNYQLTADPEFAWMFHRGLTDFDSLDEKERPRFMHTCYGLFKVCENIYLHHLRGSVSAKDWIQSREIAHAEIAHAYYATPGAQFYLASRRPAFDERYLKELEEMGTPNIESTPDVILKGKSRDSAACT